MILRTPPPKKRKAELKLLEDNYDDNTDRPSSSRQLQVYEDLLAVELSHDHSIPITSDQMLCTYQCRQMVKSEFFDALSSAEKQARDYQSKFEALNEEFSKVEAESKNFHDKFFNIEQELAAAKGREQMLCEQLKKESDFFQQHLRNHIESSSELEVKFRNEVELRKKAELSAAKAEEKAEVLEEKLSNLSESREREKSRLQNELTELRSESKLSISRISADLEKMELRAKSAEGECVLLKQQLEKLKKQLDESIQEKKEIEQKLSFRLPEAPYGDAALLVKQLQGELRNLESELREAKTQKASHEDVQLLKEKLHGEKIRRERAELDLLKFTELQLNVNKLEDELAAWKSLIKEIPGVSCADDILTKLAALQKEVVGSMMTASDARARMKEIQVALDAALLDKQNTETEAAEMKEKAESYKTEIRRLELMVDMVKDERDSLKHFFNKELKEHRDREDGTESGGRTIIQELESSLAKKENYARELEKLLSEAKNSSGLQQNEIKVLKGRLMNEERRIKMLEREDDRLRAEISLLESKIGHGEFSSAKTKVLRMVNTLAVENEAKLTIEALQTELQKTKEKLQAAEELKKQSPDAGALVDSRIAGTIKQLKEQIAILEKREQRYKTVFAERISVFRRACCELFGYKIVMDDHQRGDGMPVTRFTLHSIYALNDDEKLQFEYESGNTNIVVNEYASQPDISRQVDIFIRKMNSIPAFTANLTVESFNKRTLS